VLPEPRDEGDAKVIADIREHGWHVVIVRAGRSSSSCQLAVT